METARHIDHENLFSPKPVLTRIQLEDKHIFVLRDDLLPGGTKQRAAVPYVRQLMQMGYKEFVYASPFSGFAQVALAHACSQLGAKCTLYCEKDHSGTLHEFSQLAQSYGAEIQMCENLDVATRLAEQGGRDHSLVIPLGFNDRVFRELLEAEVQMIWDSINTRESVNELWLPIGSGTLLSTVQQVVGDRVDIYGVNVNVLPESDERISRIKANDSVRYIRCEQEFHDPCGFDVPIPSNLYYDAKLFEHLKQKARNGALWWNVAR